MASWITGQLPLSTLNCLIKETFSVLVSSIVTTSLEEATVIIKNGTASRENTIAALR